MTAEELEGFLKARKKQLRTFPTIDMKLDLPFRKITVATGLERGETVQAGKPVGLVRSLTRGRAYKSVCSEQ